MKVGATLRLTVEFRVEPLFEIARGAEGERKNSSPERLFFRQYEIRIARSCYDCASPKSR